MKDAFLRFQIPCSLTKLLANAIYDGCSTMAGAKAGVAATIQELKPCAVFTYCYGHALGHRVSDTINNTTTMKDCLHTCFG